MNQVFKRAKIDASGMHILRHSFASYLFAKGLEVKYISKILGHSSIQITYDTYVHTDFEQLKQIVTHDIRTDRQACLVKACLLYFKINICSNLVDIVFF